ncbi:hypothetical protein ACFL2V_20130 [Pseudomonadota bacterium]
MRKIFISRLVKLIVIGMIAMGLYGCALSPKVPKPKSDVPVEYKIGSWPYQENLSVHSLNTSVIFEGLTLFNNTAVVQYEIEGWVSYGKGWRPYIKFVHISERWESISSRSDKNAGNILVTPVVGVKEDKSYDGKGIRFKVSVQDYLKSGGWGLNQYNVESGGRNGKIELFQRK